MLGVAVCACLRRFRSRLRASKRLRAAFAIASACCVCDCACVRRCNFGCLRLRIAFSDSSLVAESVRGACVPRRPVLLRWARGLCGVWPLRYAGPGPRHLCAGVGPCSGSALTARGRHARRLAYPAWARARLSHSWARGSSDPLGRETVSETGHFCAGHMVSVCRPLLLAGPGPRLFCAGVGPCSGPALTTRGRHDHAHSGRRARSCRHPGVGSGRLLHRPSPRRRRGMGPGL